MMISFKGFDGWVEIFRGDKTVKDSNGIEHDGVELLEAAVKTFDPETHEPPIVKGHPEDDHPALGWVEKLKRNGLSLWAKFKQVDPVFVLEVKEGRFKKRSASFYPDGRLKHVGFLGAVPPAIKGQADMSFGNDNSFFTINFEEGNMPETTVTVAEQSGESSAGVPAGDAEKALTVLERLLAIVGWKPPAAGLPQAAASPSSALTKEDVMAMIKQAISEVATPTMKEPAAPGTPPPSDSATDEEKKKKEIEDEKAALKAEFAEKEKKIKAEFAEKEAGLKKEKLTAFFDTLKKDGKFATAWEKDGITSYAESLMGNPSEISFSEKKKETSLEWFQRFLVNLPKVVDFSEFATGDKDTQKGNAAAKLEALTLERIKAYPGKSYTSAFLEVSKEHPEITAEYTMSEVK